MSNQIQIDENTTWVVAEEVDDIEYVMGHVAPHLDVPCPGTCSPGRNEITMNADAAVRHLGDVQSSGSSSNSGGGSLPWPLIGFICIGGAILIASLAGAGVW